MLKINLKNDRILARIAVISALYTVLSLITFPVASGYIQFRLSEGLTLLPLIFPECAISLFIGCLLTNLLTGCAIFDIILGSLVSLIAGVFTALVGKLIKKNGIKLFLGGLFPVLLNAFLLPLIWLIYSELEYLYIVQVLSIFISEAISVYVVGIPINLIVKKILERN